MEEETKNAAAPEPEETPEAPAPAQKTEGKKKKKVRTIVGVAFLILFAAVTVLGFVFYEPLFGANAWCKSDPTQIPLLDAAISCLPNIIRSVQALFITLLLLYVICPMVAKLFRGTPRRVTVGKLVLSIVKVILWACGVIGVLAAWDVDVGALLAGAGILTLVVGLGMQSLIADVIAGIFLVMDGTLEVGDVVVIDGWRGNVQEIGIRNTTLINYSGDVRVANNSTIKVFVNQSAATSLPTVLVPIDYDVDVREVEKIFNENRKLIKSHVPAMTDLPQYLGMDELADSGVGLLFGASCKEDDFFAVQRALRRELKLLFDANHIKIPFPQVELSYREKEE